MTDDELKELVASLAVDSVNLHAAQKMTNEQMKLTDEQIKRTDEQIKRTDEQLKRTDEKLERLGNIHFDDVVKNMEKHRGQLQEEFDLVLTNGDVIGIVEVKYKVHENDLDKLDRKMKNFKKLFPIYQNYKQYGAIASFHINDAAKKEALRRGYFVLQRSGDLVHTESAEHLTEM